MWIGRKEFDELNKRVHDLESAKDNLQEQFNIGRYITHGDSKVFYSSQSGIYSWGDGHYEKYSLREVIELLLEHLGVDLKTVGQVPAKKVLEKKSKK